MITLIKYNLLTLKDKFADKMEKKSVIKKKSAKIYNERD